MQIRIYLFKKYANIFCRSVAVWNTGTWYTYEKNSTLERLRLRMQICLNLTPVSICLNFKLMFITYKLKYSNFKLLESILVIATTMINEKYWYFTLRPS